MTILSNAQNKPTSAVATTSERIELSNHLFTITAIIAGLTALTFLITFFFNTTWQFLVIAFAFVITFIVNLVLLSSPITQQKIYERRVVIHSISVFISFLILSAIIDNISAFIGGLILVYTVLLASSLLTERSTFTIITGIVFSIASAGVGVFTLFPKLMISSPPPAYAVILAVLALLFITSVGLMTVRFVTRALAMKLITISLIIALLPLIIISAIQSGFTSNALRDQTNQALDLAANQTATSVDSFIKTNRGLIQNEASLPAFVTYLSLPPSMRPGSPQEQQLQLTTDSISAQSGNYLSSLALLNVTGKNVFDTNALEVGNDERNTIYFIQTVLTRQVYVSPVLFAENDDPYIYFSAPIRNEQQVIIGVIRARYNASVLQNLLETNANLIGARSYPVLIDENNVRIADTLTPNLLYQSITPLGEEKVSDLISQKRLPTAPLNGYYTDLPDFQSALDNIVNEPYFTAQVLPEDTSHLMFGTSVSLANQPWTLIFLKEQSALQTLLSNQRNRTLLISIVIAGLVALLSTLFGASLSRPIVQLKSTADRISTGDLSASAIIQTSDEIGSLGNAFNLMTQRLRESIYELEDRVNERTAALATQNEELQNRSQQLLTVSDVARQIASTQELDSLLSDVTTLISDRFNFYHVGIFLIDEKQEYAYLRAANSEGGQKMLARQHKLKVGQVGMVGYVTGAGEPRISTDVGKDAVFFNNPDLPLTRSEMALPLKIGSQIIGALDVQSVKSDAFSEEDVKLFTTLADQVAIAIQNNLLYTQTTSALQEAQSLHRQYLNQEWRRESGKRQHAGYVYTSAGVSPLEGALASDAERSLDSGEVVITNDATSGNEALRMVMPIKLRGEPIGVIQLNQVGQPDREWSENEIATVQSVADQVAQALENARLFEQTVRRAERERRALDITNKIRSTNDPQAMLEIAVKELQQALGTSRAQIFIQTTNSNLPSTGKNTSPDDQDPFEKQSNQV